MKKFKLFLNYEKEERWLADMASQGYQLKETDFGYSFEKTLPEQAVIKIDYRRFKKEQDFLDYLALFEDSGWQHISGTKKSGSQYFKKTNSDSTEDIFSDTASRAGRYKRLSDMWFSLFIPFLFISSMLGDKVLGFLNPKTLYLTPGLWEMSGSEFWRHFWFETPFALMRGLPPLIMALCAILFAIFYMAADRLYKKTINTDNR